MNQEFKRTTEETTVNEPYAQVDTCRVVVAEPRIGETTKGDYETKKVIFRSYQIIWYILGLIEVMLGFRFILLILGADSASGFVNLIYNLSAPLVAPFVGIFGVTQTSGSVFEWSAIIAMIVYAIVAYGVVAIFQMVKPTNKTEVEGTIDN